MGSDARIYVFDYERYAGEVVPAFRRLLLYGVMEAWLQGLWRADADDCDRFDLTLPA